MPAWDTSQAYAERGSRTRGTHTTEYPENRNRAVSKVVMLAIISSPKIQTSQDLKATLSAPRKMSKKSPM
jgi:hypothetical protein